jgi:hypothetical protein
MPGIIKRVRTPPVARWPNQMPRLRSGPASVAGRAENRADKHPVFCHHNVSEADGHTPRQFGSTSPPSATRLPHHFHPRTGGRHVRGAPMPKKACVLTFDTATEQLDRGAPLMAKYS